MPSDLYQDDILAWSEHQAELLRRVARGERVNDVDWPHVVEEIEDVGLSELNAVQSYLRQTLVHLLKIHAWPDNPSSSHWREETAAFQADAAQRFAPSMRQRIDLGQLYGRALKQLRSADYGSPAPAWPAACPFTLEALLQDDAPTLIAYLQQPEQDPA